MSQTISKIRSNSILSEFKISEEASQVALKLKKRKPFLSLKDEDTLSIITDKKLLRHIKKSLKEAREGRLEPLRRILE